MPRFLQDHHLIQNQYQPLPGTEVASQLARMLKQDLLLQLTQELTLVAMCARVPVLLMCSLPLRDLLPYAPQGTPAPKAGLLM
jgi:hypothetical protein